MAIRIVTQLPHDKFEKVLEEISFIGSLEEALTPRSKKTLLRRLHAKHLIMAFDDQTLAGWGIVEPLAPGVVELGFLFVKREYRASSAFHDIARELVLRKETVLFAAYDQKLFEYVQRVYGFRQSDLTEFVKLSRGKFILKRLNSDSLRSIRDRQKTKQPIYAVLERNA